ncbi:MAG: glycosyltransferase family 39 protein [Bifidobacteriaceae bacterium]|jgi:hypothetical protein|nr:glycosyltransferase family 39 protein [Bifidobacteriaceae bacterium]
MVRKQKSSKETSSSSVKLGGLDSSNGSGKTGALITGLGSDKKSGKKSSISSGKLGWIKYAIAFLFFPILVAFYIGQDPCWFDEGFTVLILRHNFGGILDVTINDVHPPLYYFLVKIFMMIPGISALKPLIALRLFSVICSLLILLMVIKILELILNKQDLLISAVLVFLTTSPFFMRYSVEGRMYTMDILLVLLGLYLALKIFYNASVDNKKTVSKSSKKTSEKTLGNLDPIFKYSILFALVSLACVYTHYLLIFPIFAEALFIVYTLVKYKKLNNLYKFFASIGVAIILYLPWLPTFISHTTDGSPANYHKTDMNRIEKYFQLMFAYRHNSKPTTLEYIIILFVLLSLLIATIFFLKKSKNNKIKVVIAAIYLVMFLSIGATLVSQVFIARYSIWCFVLYAILITIFATENKSILLIFFVLTLVNVFIGYPNFKQYRNDPYLVSVFFEENYKPGDIILSSDYWTYLEIAGDIDEDKLYYTELGNDVSHNWDAYYDMMRDDNPQRILKDDIPGYLINNSTCNDQGEPEDGCEKRVWYVKGLRFNNVLELWENGELVETFKVNEN